MCLVRKSDRRKKKISIWILIGVLICLLIGIFSQRFVQAEEQKEQYREREILEEIGEEIKEERKIIATDEIQMERKTKAENEIGAQGETESETETKSETESEIETETETETNTETELETKIETNTESGAGIKNETEMESEAETKNETETESEAETKNETEMESEIETENETKTGSEAETKKETEMESGAETKNQIEMENETESEAETTKDRELEETILAMFEEVEEQTQSYYSMASEIPELPNTFKLVCSEYPDYPHAPDNMQKSSLKLAMTSRKKVIFNEADGSKTTRTAYCLQPAVNSPGSGNTYDTNTAIEITDTTVKDQNLMKALYYLYGGPAWDNKIAYEDGSGTVNLKVLLNNDGKDCTTADEYYCLSHYVLAYLYLGEDGKWNYMYTTMPEGPVLNNYGVKAVKKIAEAIKKLPIPDAGLSETSVRAAYRAAEGMNVSPSITYQAIEENAGKMTLPAGIFLVNETNGTRESGTVSLKGGDHFHLESETTLTGTETYTIKTTYATDFTAMKLLKSGNYQDVGFSYYSGNNQLMFEVEWPNLGELKLKKVNAETNTAEVYNEQYSLAGAVYGVYTDANCTSLITEVITDQGGIARVQIPLGTYYVKELQPPKGFYKNSEIFSVTIEADTDMTEMVVSDQPIKERIQIQKKDAQTGKAEPLHEQVMLAGAEYTIYGEPECKTKIETLVCDAKGSAVSQELELGTYYVKETKASCGYVMDSTIYKIILKEDDQTELYVVSSEEEIIRGGLSLMKYLDDNMEESILQDLYEEGTLEGICFILKHEGESVEPVIIVTDRYGYASTEKNALVYGTWYLTEDPDTTPKGYEGVSNVKIELREDGEEKMYVVTNKPYEAYLCIRKTDGITGSVITRDTAEFQILDEKGNVVSMPTFDGYQDTFSTNEKGEIHLTRPLKGGTYSLVEIKVPEGYKRAEPMSFTITKNAIFQEPFVIEYENIPKMGKIQITKVDKETGEHCGAGFEFEIIAAEDILDGSGNLRKELMGETEQELVTGTIVDTVMTNEDGIAVSRELYPGKYRIREKKAGEYYACSREEYSVEISVREAEEESGKEMEVILADIEIANEKTSLQVIKQDGKNERVLAGVTFAFWEKGKEEERRIKVTDEKGSISFTELKHNSIYYLQELETLEGYVLDMTIYEIGVDEQGMIDGQANCVMKLSNIPKEKQEEPEVKVPETEAVEMETETEVESETERTTEKETQTQKKTEIVVVNGSDAAKTGDVTPLAGMMFLATCSLIFCMAEIMRRIKY